MIRPNEPGQATTIDQRIAAMIYACIIRASERIGGETGHHVGNRADQIQPGLNEFATAFDLAGITLGTVENDRPEEDGSNYTLTTTTLTRYGSVIT